MAVPADALAEARRLERALQSLRGWVARFTQTVESPGLPGPQVERGTVYLLRPGRMRFEYSQPAGKLVVADGRRAWLYLPEDRQVLVTPMEAGGAARGIALLMRDRIRIEKEFNIEWQQQDRAQPETRRLRLSPRSPQAEYEHLLVEVAADGLIAALTAVDALGGQVTYRFTLARRVDRLEDSLFRYTPPPGVEVREVAP